MRSIFSHGDPRPSIDDITATTRLQAAGQILGIELLDHIIVGDDVNGKQPYFSFKESGLLDQTNDSLSHPSK